MRRVVSAVAAMFLFGTFSARAEFLQMDLSIFGMD